MFYVKHRYFSLFFLSMIGLTLPGCFPKYKSKALKPLTRETAQFKQTKDNITLAVKKYTKEEANSSFDGRGKGLYNKKNPIYALQCAVTNRSQTDVALDQKGISLKTVSLEQTINLMKHNQILRCAGLTGLGLLGVAGSFVAGGAIAFALVPTCHAGNSVSGGCAIGRAIFTGFAGGLAGAVVGLGAVIVVIGLDAKATSQANKALIADLKKQTMWQSISIKPGQELNFLFFVEHNFYQPQFDITFNTEKNKPITFAVDLTQTPSEFVVPQQ